MDSVDDRGNVVDIYAGGEDRSGRLDREAEPLPGLDFEFGFGFDGGFEEMQTLIREGYESDLAGAIICEFLRGEECAVQHAKDFVIATFA